MGPASCHSIARTLSVLVDSVSLTVALSLELAESLAVLLEHLTRASVEEHRLGSPQVDSLPARHHRQNSPSTLSVLLNSICSSICSQTLFKNTCRRWAAPSSYLCGYSAFLHLFIGCSSTSVLDFCARLQCQTSVLDSSVRLLCALVLPHSQITLASTHSLPPAHAFKLQLSTLQFTLRVIFESSNQRPSEVYQDDLLVNSQQIAGEINQRVLSVERLGREFRPSTRHSTRLFANCFKTLKSCCL